MGLPPFHRPLYASHAGCAALCWGSAGLGWKGRGRLERACGWINACNLSCGWMGASVGCCAAGTPWVAVRMDGRASSCLAESALRQPTPCRLPYHITHAAFNSGILSGNSPILPIISKSRRHLPVQNCARPGCAAAVRGRHRHPGGCCALPCLPGTALVLCGQGPCGRQRHPGGH